nr:hypothetical protein [Tanacetum cinerariifolium]
RYWGTLDLVEYTEYESLDLDTEEEGSEDEGPGQQVAVLVVDTMADEPLGLGYGALRRHELTLGEGSMPSTFNIGQSSRSTPGQQRVEETLVPRIPVCTILIDPEDSTVYLDITIDPRSCTPVQTPTSPEWSSGSLLVLPSSPIVPDLVASPVTSPIATIAIDEDEFLEVGAQLELYGSILHDHIQRLDALLPILFEGYDRDFRELYTRSREVRDEIFSQHYRLRSLEQKHEQEKATVTFGALLRPMLALESWAGHVDAQRAEI